MDACKEFDCYMKEFGHDLEEECKYLAKVQDKQIAMRTTTNYVAAFVDRKRNAKRRANEEEQKHSSSVTTNSKNLKLTTEYANPFYSRLDSSNKKSKVVHYSA